MIHTQKEALFCVANSQPLTTEQYLRLIAWALSQLFDIQPLIDSIIYKLFNKQALCNVF